MIKRYTSFLIFIAINFTNLSGQASVLFVDDSDDTFGNAELLHSALESIGYNATYYNAVDSAAGPSDLYMNDFDLVIWHTSSDGSELLLWNGLDEDNASLKSYLNGGGKLWLVGNDFFFDRYGASTVDFSVGDFAYDYLGVRSLDVQSYADDGELGVPIMLPDSDAIIPGLNDLTWQFATLWYADGVSLTEEATPIYRMGDASYILADTISAAYHDNGTFQVLTYFFDVALVNNFDMLKANLLSVMSFFEGTILDVDNFKQANGNVTLFPNPTSNGINVELELVNTSDVSISLVNLNGQVIEELMKTQKKDAGRNVYHFNLNADIANSYYFVKININGEPIMKSILLQN